MKRIRFYLVTVVLLTALFTACEEEEQSFEESLLIGKWKLERAGDAPGEHLYERYNADGSGKTWDVADDVQESEAQLFTWTLEKSDLTQIHIMEIGGSVPKYYTVTELTSSSLRYKDDFGKSFSFTKVSN